MSQSHRQRDAFIQVVEQALENFSDNLWLGHHSPLAAPYFLGKVLDDYANAENFAVRGQALANILRKTSEHLTTDQQYLLKISFFQRNTSLNNTGVALHLGYSDATYYRHRTNAIEALAHLLSQQLLPPLHPETPRLQAMVGRNQILTRSIHHLQTTQTIAITGPGGIGKTTFGLALMEAWGSQRTFWFTVRPGLNDDLSSLVFALGYFLRGLGAMNTWRQLVADQGTLNKERILGLLRHDFVVLRQNLPLLCIDELDLLRTELNEHAQILYLLEALRDTVPLVLLSQQLMIDPHQHLILTNFTLEEVELLLTQLGIVDFSPVQQRQLIDTTRGNPALLTLLLTLHQAGEPLLDMLAALTGAPSLELLLLRIWKRLDPEEREILMALAVFRTFAPQDAWTQEQIIVERLFKRQLVTFDGYGGVALLPYVRSFVYQRIAAALKAKLQGGAAQIREARGEYTAAAYHYLAAQQPTLGIWVWFNHRTEEINRGRGAVALALFKDVDYSALTNDEDRRALVILRAELLKLVGAAEEAEAELQSVIWSLPHPTTPYIQQLYGDVLTMQEGRQMEALERYRVGLQLIAGSAQLRQTELLIRRGYIYLHHLHDIEKARQEGLQARLMAEDFYGNVEEEAGNYTTARSHYESALQLLEQIQDNLQFRSRIHSNLGRLLWRQGDSITAIAHLEQAMDYSEQRGDIVRLIHDQVNLSGAYIIAGRYAEALEQARTGLHVAESMRNAYLSAGLASNAAEACYYLNRLDEAERYAMYSLQREEEAHRPYALTVLGLVESAQSHLDKAEHWLRNAIECAQTIGDKYAEAAAWNALGRNYRDQQNVDPSQKAYEQAHRLYRELGLSKNAEDMGVNIDKQKLLQQNL